MKRILASVATATLALGGLVATATSAAAHTPDVDATCSSLSVALTSYAAERHGKENTVTVVVDGETVLEESFGTTFHQTLQLDPSAVQEWSVAVDAWDDDRWDETESGPSPACGSGDKGKDKGWGGHGGKNHDKGHGKGDGKGQGGDRDKGDREVQTAFYVYPKVDPTRPAAWENSGEQTLITVRDGDEFWDELPAEYPGDLFDVADLPDNVCEGSWGVQQDTVGIHRGFDWAEYQHITYPHGPLFKDLRKWRHSELADILPECGEQPAGQVTPAVAFEESCDADSTVDYENTDEVTYQEQWTDDRTEVTVTAVLADGVELAPGAATTWTFTATGEMCAPEPVETPETPAPTPSTTADVPQDTAMIPGDIGAVCESDVPYLAYAVSLPEGVEAEGDTPLTVTFLNPDGEDHVTTDLPLEGRLLWPGASATEPLQWPGWELVDGSYVETDGNFAWTRDGVQVLFEVNPDYSTVVEYPEGTAECANPPSDVVEADQGDVVDVDAEDVDQVAATGEELPRTGATVGIAAAVAALLLAAGATLFLMRRRIQGR